MTSSVTRPAGVADDVGVAGPQAERVLDVEPGVHAGDDGQARQRRGRQRRAVERLGVALVLAHGASELARVLAPCRAVISDSGAPRGVAPYRSMSSPIVSCAERLAELLARRSATSCAAAADRRSSSWAEPDVGEALRCPAPRRRSAASRRAASSTVVSRVIVELWGRPRCVAGRAGPAAVSVRGAWPASRRPPSAWPVGVGQGGVDRPPAARSAAAAAAAAGRGRGRARSRPVAPVDAAAARVDRRRRRTGGRRRRRPPAVPSRPTARRVGGGVGGFGPPPPVPPPPDGRAVARRRRPRAWLSSSGMSIPVSPFTVATRLGDRAGHVLDDVGRAVVRQDGQRCRCWPSARRPRGRCPAASTGRSG